MKTLFLRAVLPLAVATLLTACGGKAPESDTTEAGAKDSTHEAAAAKDIVPLSAQQIQAAGIVLVRPSVGGAMCAIEFPATIAGDPHIRKSVVEGKSVTEREN